MATTTTTEPPFDNVKVRRAMAIGTDRQAFIDLYGAGPQPLHVYPLFTKDPTVYTPLEKLPPDIQELYEYDPVKARKMLDEEGIPEGFKVTVKIQTGAVEEDRASLLKAIWEKIGVDVDIETYDLVTIRKLRDEQEYEVTDGGLNMTNPVNGLWRAGKKDYFLNTSGWENDRYEELLVQIGAEEDDAKRMELAKEAALIILKESPVITVNMSQRGVFWWPWIQNYYGEVTVDDYTQFAAFMATAWIDENLKKEMGF